jgi:hypothetical protein
MTSEQVASASGSGNQPLSVARILDLCDRLVAELGRRQHLFAWLRPPGAGPEEWLQVDAYYPGNRLVVVWHERPGPHDHVYSELVPARGLRLLELTPSDVAGGLEGAERTLRRMIAALGPAPQRASEPAPLEVVEEPRAVRSQPAMQTQRAGLILGLSLAGVLLLEVYFGVVGAGLDGGQVVLAFGLALDACARALGTIAASRDGEPDWAWWSALGGSPVVAALAWPRRGGPARADPAPLAGLLSALALGALTIALLAALL